jgi:hypothetical protein
LQHYAECSIKKEVQPFKLWYRPTSHRDSQIWWACSILPLVRLNSQRLRPSYERVWCPLRGRRIACISKACVIVWWCFFRYPFDQGSELSIAASHTVEHSSWPILTSSTVPQQSTCGRHYTVVLHSYLLLRSYGYGNTW